MENLTFPLCISETFLYIVCSPLYTDVYDYAYILAKNPDLLQGLLAGFESYKIMAGSLIQVYREESNSQMNPTDVHVRIWENKLNILHLNTAILSDGERGHAEAVDINLACSEQIRNQLSNGLPTIVLGHHSFHDLHPTIKKRLVQMFNQTNVWAYLAGDKHKTNYQGDEFLIYRKTGIDAWPNIVAGKMAATLDDDYSDFGAILYCWDGFSTVTLTHLQWEAQSSGKGLNMLAGDAKRSFPMCGDVDSQLYNDLLERLIQMRNRHPSFQLMKIDEELFPKAYLDINNCTALERGDDESENVRLLSDFFQESWNREKKNHLMLEGEGGIGKTIALLSLTTQKDFLPLHVPAIYIALHALKTKDFDDCIGRYILEEILDGNEQQYKELNAIANQVWQYGPRLVLLLDGFNEISLEARYSVARNIEEWSNKRGIQIITASRFDVRNFLPGLTGEFHALRLQPLTRNQIQNHLEQAGILVPPHDSILWTVIDYPLMLALYTQTESIQKQSSSVQLDWREAKNAGTILWNYLQRELWRCQRYTRNWNAPVKCVLATECIAPYIAWEMVQEERFIVSEEKFYILIQRALENLLETDNKNWPTHTRKIIHQSGGRHCLPDEEELFDLLTREINLFRIRESANGFVVSLMHQQFRDCLASIHLLNIITTISEEGLPEVWKNPIDYYVMNFVAELINSADASQLWEANRISLPTNPISTRMMLELQKRLRDYDFSQLDFSGMDLREVHLYGYRKPDSNALLLPKAASHWDRTQISEETFEPEGHRHGVVAVAIPLRPLYGRCCVSTSWDNTLRIWDILSGDCLHVLKGHKYSVDDVAITLDGKLCVSASQDNTLRIWDVSSGDCLHVLEGHKNCVEAVEITSDGKYCVSASWDHTLRIWDMSSGECLHILEGHEDDVRTVEITSDGKYCVSVSEDNTLRIWDMSSGECLHILEGHEDDVRAVEITSDGKYCVSASEDNTLRIWDMSSGECLHILEGHKDIVHAVEITSDGKYCVSASWDYTLRIWDMSSGECLHILEGHEYYIWDVLITSDGTHCVSASSDKTLRIWDMSSGECLHILEGHEDDVRAVATTSDGKYCVSASDDGSLRIWDILSGKCLNTLEGYEERIYAVLISSDGNFCVSALMNGILYIWDVLSGKCLHILEGHKSRVSMIVITPDENRCVSASCDDTLRIWDMSSGKCLHILEGHTNLITDVAITSDGNRCVSVSWDHTLRIWDMLSGKCLHILEEHEDNVTAVSITQDGKYCVSASWDNTLRIWDISSGECLHILEGHEYSVYAVSITQDGKYCVSASGDHTLRIWDMSSGECLNILEGHEESVYAVSITINGKYCVSASSDHTLRIWDMSSGECLHILEGHINKVNAASITSDGKYCVSASDDNTLRVWDIISGRCLHVLEGYRDYENMQITLGGNRCISTSQDGSIHIWDLSSGECLRTLQSLFGLNLLGLDLSLSTIVPSTYAEILYQNGVIVR